MNRLTLACSALLIACFGCTGTQTIGFGPFSSSSIAGGAAAGVASFIPGTAPKEGEFRLVVINTNSTTIFEVSVTPSGTTTTTKQAQPCNAAFFTAGCDVGTVVINVTATGLENPAASFTLITDSSCKEQVVFIATGTAEADEGGAETMTVELTQTAPIEAATCGLGL